MCVESYFASLHFWFSFLILSRENKKKGSWSLHFIDHLNPFLGLLQNIIKHAGSAKGTKIFKILFDETQNSKHKKFKLSATAVKEVKPLTFPLNALQTHLQFVASLWCDLACVSYSSYQITTRLWMQKRTKEQEQGCSISRLQMHSWWKAWKMIWLFFAQSFPCLAYFLGDNRKEFFWQQIFVDWCLKLLR